MKRLIPFFLALGLLTPITTLWGAAPPSYSFKFERRQLEAADLVVIGEVVRIKQTITQTTARIQVLEVIKGVSEEGFVTVRAEGGKVYPAEGQPVFSTYQKCLLFLKEGPSGAYTCLNDADGQKIIRNDNIYPYLGNVKLSLKLADYLERLQAPEKALEVSPGGPVPNPAATP